MTLDDTFDQTVDITLLEGSENGAARRERALRNWTRTVLELPTKSLQSEFLARISNRHGPALGEEVLVRALLARALEQVKSGRTKEVLARVEREIGWAVAEKVRDRLAQHWFKLGKNNDDAREAVAEGRGPGSSQPEPERALP